MIRWRPARMQRDDAHRVAILLAVLIAVSALGIVLLGRF